ncbi:MAG: ribose-phosphate pyrophosphokinase [Wenzhouxiangellaceae bacterium]
MSRPTLIALPGAETLADQLARIGGFGQSALEYRRFPDGESYLRLADRLHGDVVIVARLDHPDPKIPALLFAAELARERGAERLGLVCPYLPYMRQDAIFNPGEALTSASFAGWISERFDGLLTVDPHLHRYPSLDRIYRLHAIALSAARLVGEWIAGAIERPLIVGPDAESRQWAEAVATPAGLPWITLKKHRLGDRKVRVEADGDLHMWADHTPVLVDDIISSGHTLAQAARVLQAQGLRAPSAVAVHGLLDDHARRVLADAGIPKVVCTDSVPIPESGIALAPLLAPALDRLFRR